MRFQDRLNEYIIDIGCTAKELSDASGVSTAVISRYRSGERVPQENSEQIRLLAEGIALLEVRKNGKHLDPDSICREFALCISGITVSYDTFLSNLHALLAVLQITNNQLSQAMQFDPSYISRILSGQRRPAELPALIAGISEYIAIRHTSEAKALALSDLTGISLRDIRSSAKCAEALSQWLGSNKESRSAHIADVLKSLDSFDLSSFIRSLRFDTNSPERKPLAENEQRVITDFSALQDAELDFLHTCLISPFREDLWFYNDMPIEFWGEDPVFMHTYLSLIAELLKKGHHLHIIHNVYRPFKEMMLGLEVWVPLYMTGRISPYYLKNNKNDTFRHFLWVSGDVVLVGGAISGYPEEGRFLFSRAQEQVSYYKLGSKRLFSHAQPLFRIFRSEQAKLLRTELLESMHIPGSRRVIYSSPPLFAISEDLLLRILKRNRILSRTRKQILQHRLQYIEQVETILSHSEICMEIPEITEEEYRRYPVSLELSGMFYEDNIILTYEEYLEHLAQTADFIASHENCTMKMNIHAAFRNLKIMIREGSGVLVSRNTAPSIHWLIKQPNLRNAFENFVVPVVDQ